MLAEREVEVLAAEPDAAALFLRRVVLYYGLPEAVARAELDGVLRRHRVNISLHRRRTLERPAAKPAPMGATGRAVQPLTSDELDRFFSPAGFEHLKTEER